MYFMELYCFLFSLVSTSLNKISLPFCYLIIYIWVFFNYFFKHLRNFLVSPIIRNCVMRLLDGSILYLFCLALD